MDLSLNILGKSKFYDFFWQVCVAGNLKIVPESIKSTETIHKQY